jgi:hypothetical protein
MLTNLQNTFFGNIKKTATIRLSETKKAQISLIFIFLLKRTGSRDRFNLFDKKIVLHVDLTKNFFNFKDGSLMR